MKLNNKGFAISGVLYSLLILFVTLFIGVLTILASTKFSLDKVKNDVNNKLETLTYRDTILNGADPVLKTGMIPVTIEPDGTVRKADITKKWYDYDTKTWANAVTVSESNRETYMTADPGTTILETDILTYFVWIPRYRYRLWYVEAQDGDNGFLDESKVHSIDIIFEGKNMTKSNGAENGEYLTHPAFTFGEEELNGIWVGKFETGYNGANTKEEAEVKSSDYSKVIIKPNTYSWRDNRLPLMFQISLKMNLNEALFGLKTDSKTHMMKNIEWGAVTYLAYSKYGKDSEVYLNNNSNFLTGCGADSATDPSNTSCLNRYGTKDNNVYNQSTAGNISGIFDMSGGAFENVMGYTTSASPIYASSGFTQDTFPEAKYVNIYSSTSNSQYSNRILGDATGEMGPFKGYQGSWYNGNSYFMDSGYPWIRRGGDYESASSSGLENFYASSGGPWNRCSFRIVLV